MESQYYAAERDCRGCKLWRSDWYGPLLLLLLLCCYCHLLCMLTPLMLWHLPAVKRDDSKFVQMDLNTQRSIDIFSSSGVLLASIPVCAATRCRAASMIDG
jgi:hypothetical protein